MENKRLFVGNLSFSATEEDLLNAFAEFRPSSPRIIGDRGFAFIEIPGDQLDDCIAKMDGQEVRGRAIRVSEAKPREDRGGGGGGYGGGGGGRGGYGGGGGGRDRRGGGRDW
jgi:RNA recognition motif-containing protein